MRNLFYILLILLSLPAGSQNKLGKEWITGGGGQRIKFLGNSIFTSNAVFYNSYFTRGNSNICDTNGNLILCSDGYNVYDSSANYIDGGDTLIPKDYYIDQYGWSADAQASIFLPIDSDKYYFITPTMSNARYADCIANSYCAFDLLLYNVIDMKANAGAGKVIKRMLPLMENAELSKTQMMACRHANGKDWWLLKQGDYQNIVYKFLFTQDSIYNYGSQNFNAPLWPSGWDLRGQSMFTQDGSKYATTVDGIPATGEVFIADFDRCTGLLTNEKVIYCPLMTIHNPNDSSQKQRTTVALAFSPNGQLLYVISPNNIWQYDLQDTSWYHVAGLDTSWVQFQDYNASYLGPDNKLYIGNGNGLSRQMSRIDNPDVKGPGCNFCPRCLRMDTLIGNFSVGTPPCMPNYSLGKDSCFAVGVGEYEISSGQLVVWPNPAHNQLLIVDGKLLIKELYNNLGQLILRTKENEMYIGGLAAGMYYLKCGAEVVKVVVE